MRPIEIIHEPITKENLFAHAHDGFGDMVKIVVDLERGVLALGGELHSDGEALLLQDGSKQENVWGANVYPEQPKETRIEFSSLINIRPQSGHRTMELHDAALEGRLRVIINRLIP